MTTKPINRGNRGFVPGIFVFSELTAGIESQRGELAQAKLNRSEQE